MGGDCALVYEPDLLERLDWWSFSEDTFGRSKDVAPDNRGGAAVVNLGRKTLENEEKARRNEQMFPGGIGLEHLRVIATPSEKVRLALIDKLHALGIDSINERPIEDVVVGTTSFKDLDQLDSAQAAARGVATT